MNNTTPVNIKVVKLKEGVSRMENAQFFLEQIGNHTKFRVGNDVVELKFNSEGKSLALALASYLSKN